MKENIIDHWEQALNSKSETKALYNSANNSTYMVTCRQAALIEAQNRLDKLTDKHNELAIKTLSHQELSNKELPEDIELGDLFDDNNSKPDGKETEVVEKFGDESPDHFVEKLPTNILDRNRSQLIKDQKADVTLRNLSISNSPPKDNDGYYYKDGVLLHRKYTRYPRDGISYVDRVVAPEAYRPEILRVGHSLPMAGHMGQEKTYQRVSRHFFWPHIHREVLCQSTGYSPFELLYGRTVRGPFSLITDAWIGKEALQKNAISYVLETRWRLSKMQNIVQENANKTQAKQLGIQG